MDLRALATLIAAGRTAVGVGAFLFPTRFARSWVGTAGAHPSLQPLARGLAARDLALGIGSLLAMKHGRGVRGWSEAGALADLGDALGTVMSWRQLPEKERMVVLAVASASAAAGLVIARGVEDEVGLDARDEAPAWRPAAPGTSR